MKTIEVAKATLPLADYTNKVKKQPVIVTVKGKPVAALVGISNADIETVSLSNNPQFINLIERSRSRQKREHISMIRENPDGSKTLLTMPNHSKIKASTPRTICTQAGISRDDFLNAYDET